MHELSIALSIIEMAEEEAAKRQASIAAVHLRLGPLAGVVKDALLAAFAMAIEGTPLEGSRLVIEEVPIVVNCPACREPRTLAGSQLFRCPVCDSPTPDVVQGADLQVTALELHHDTSTANRRDTAERTEAQ